jgi:hypothetical protein
MPENPDFLPLDDEQEIDLAHAYLKFSHAEARTPEWHALFWTWKRMHYLASNLPQKAWRVILLTWSLHQCPNMAGSLSSHIRFLLLRHPSEMLPLLEAEARRDPAFAELLGNIEQIALTDEVYARVVAAREGRAWEGLSGGIEPSVQLQHAVRAELMPREDERDEDLAEAYIARQKAGPETEQWDALYWTHERTQYLTNYLPRRAWRVILLIWSMDQSTETMQSLSAGEIENLLSWNGTEIISHVEDEYDRISTVSCRSRHPFARQIRDWKVRRWREFGTVSDAVKGWDRLPLLWTCGVAIRKDQPVLNEESRFPLGDSICRINELLPHIAVRNVSACGGTRGEI